MTTELVTIPNGRWPLHGVLHRPAHTAQRRVGVLIVQESYNTKFGPHRIFVRLGEALSQGGFHALRYDNRGTCDSEGFLDITFEDRLADSETALAYFRESCQLEAVIVWGLCMGATVAAHLTRGRRTGIDGLVLCSILADPRDASLPQLGYANVDVGEFLKDSWRRGDWWGKVRRVGQRFSHYRRVLGRLAVVWVRAHVSPKSELARLRAAIQQVGRLLARYEGPCLLIFGEKDETLAHFQERVNPGDRLGLARKPRPPDVVIIGEGDHTFASREQMTELLRVTLDWLTPLQHGRRPAMVNRDRGVGHGVSAAPVAE